MTGTSPTKPPALICRSIEAAADDARGLAEARLHRAPLPRPEQRSCTAITIWFFVARTAGLRDGASVMSRKGTISATPAPPGTVDSFVVRHRARRRGGRATQAIVRGAASAFDLLFVHLPDVDLAGHAEALAVPGLHGGGRRR